MEENKYYFKISPEVIANDLFYGCYCSIDGTPQSSFVYSGMSDILSGNTGGTSLLTGLTIPLLFTQSAVDCGYYSIFDGAISQIDVVKNFIFSATTSAPNTYYFYNTSDINYKNYLALSTMYVDWGDGSPQQVVTTTAPNYINHTYSLNGVYTIKLIQNNPWGMNVVKKTVTVPYTGTTIPNPNGTAYFTPNVGSWSATPISYDYIFTGDSNNNVASQVSSNYVTTPFLFSGYTNSRVTDLKLYGTNPYQLGVMVYDDNNQPYGLITSITTESTGYTINNISYVDFIDDTTIYFVNSSGLTSDWLESVPIVKNESLLNIIFSPEVQSDIFIERGKVSVLENIERLGEVDNIGDLEKYGYGFFNFYNQQNIR